MLAGVVKRVAEIEFMEKFGDIENRNEKNRSDHHQNRRHRNPDS